jgi:DNA-binding transcriptional MerR regulator
MASEFKDISDLIKQGMQVEAIEKLLDLREMMANLRDDNLALKERLQTLEKSLEDKSQLTYEAPFYWMIKGDVKDGPFCQQCCDSSKITIRLQLEGNDYWSCRTCKQAYTGPDHQIPRLF